MVTIARYEATHARLNDYHGMKLLMEARYSSCTPPPGPNVCHCGDGPTVFSGRYYTSNISPDNSHSSELLVSHRGDGPTVTSAHFEAAPTFLNNYSGMKFLAVARHNGCALPPGLNVCQRGNGTTVFRGRYCTPNTSLDNNHSSELLAVARYSGGAPPPRLDVCHHEDSRR